MLHRVGGPAYRTWTMEPDGTRTPWCEEWWVDGVSVDGPVFCGHLFWWQDRHVREEDPPWLRRGRDLLVALAGPGVATAQHHRDWGGGSGVSPAWSQDARVAMTWHGGRAGDAAVATYRSMVGGVVLLCV